MFKEFMLRSMMSRQLKGVSKEEQERMFALISDNPELFKNIAESAQKKIAAGKSQMDAIMEASREYEEELKRAIQQKEQS